MDGATLTRDLQYILQETSSTAWMDAKTTYDYLYEAAVATAKRSRVLTGTQSITTTASGQSYNLNADFMGLYLKDDYDRHYIQINDGTNTHLVYEHDYERIISDNNTTSQAIPSGFSIVRATDPTRITGTATSTAAASNGEALLTDTNTDLSSVSVGDLVHNTTDTSLGVVVATNTSTSVYVALFGGTNNDWTSADTYFIMPQARFKLFTDPACSTAAYTITVYYLKRPDPVYSTLRSYNFPIDFRGMLVKYAAWLYKYRDREPNYGDAFYQHWDRQVRQYTSTVNKSFAPPRLQYKVITNRRNYR